MCIVQLFRSLMPRANVIEKGELNVRLGFVTLARQLRVRVATVLRGRTDLSTCANRCTY
jgi:hypothetical protein